MITKIKALSRGEFEAACANGYVYGKYLGKRDIYTFASLGMEKDYIPSPNDDPKTEYRIFINCIASFTTTKERLLKGDFETEDLPVATIVIYY